MVTQTNPSQVVFRVLALLQNVREQGDGWSARCSTHEDSPTVCQSGKERMGGYCLSVMQEEAVVRLLREEGVEIEGDESNGG